MNVPAPLFLENKYNLSKIRVTNDTTIDGDDVPRPDVISEPGKTLVVHYLNSYLHKLITAIIDMHNITNICIISETNVGFFNCFSGEKVENYIGYHFDPIKYSSHKESDQRVCFLCDFSALEFVVSRDNPFKNIFECMGENDLLVNIGSIEGFVAGVNNCRKIFFENEIGISLVLELSGPKMIIENYNSFQEFDSLNKYLYLTVAKKGPSSREYIKEVNIYYEDFEFLKEVENSLVNIDLDLAFGASMPPFVYMGRGSWYASQKIKSQSESFSHLNRAKLIDLVEIISMDGQKIGKEKYDFIDVNVKSYFSVVAGQTIPLNCHVCEESEPSSNMRWVSRSNTVSLHLNLDLINPYYFINYVYSDMGLNTLNSMFPSNYVPLSLFLNYLVYLPDLLIQQEILQSYDRYETLITKMRSEYYGIRFDAFIDEKSRLEIERKFDSVQSAIGMLGDLSRIKNSIVSGESVRLEFKQTFCMDIKTGEKAKYIEDSAIKTIAGFLNSEGGNLLCGVADNGELVGLSDEIRKYFKSSDAFLLHVKNVIKQRIGAEYYPFVSFKLLEIEEALLLEFVCSPSNSPVFVDDKDFYVRTNPATDRLEGRKLHEYISHRFK